MSPLRWRISSMTSGISRSEAASGIFINACNEFQFLENVGGRTRKPSSKKKAAAEEEAKKKAEEEEEQRQLEEQEQRFREQQAMRLRYQARRLNDEILTSLEY